MRYTFTGKISILLDKCISLVILLNAYKNNQLKQNLILSFSCIILFYTVLGTNVPNR